MTESEYATTRKNAAGYTSNRNRVRSAIARDSSSSTRRCSPMRSATPATPLISRPAARGEMGSTEDTPRISAGYPGGKAAALYVTGPTGTCVFAAYPSRTMLVNQLASHWSQIPTALSGCCCSSTGNLPPKAATSPISSVSSARHAAPATPMTHDPCQVSHQACARVPTVPPCAALAAAGCTALVPPSIASTINRAGPGWPLASAQPSDDERRAVDATCDCVHESRRRAVGSHHQELLVAVDVPCNHRI